MISLRDAECRNLIFSGPGALSRSPAPHLNLSESAMHVETITPRAVCSFPECGRKRLARGFCGGHYVQARRGGNLRPLLADRDVAADFWARVDRSGGPDACWPWTAGRTAAGYGAVRFDGRTRKAHRVAWTLANGPIPAGEGYHGMCVLHRCDNPPCVNPDHLFLGSNDENMADMVAKGRQASGDRSGARLHPESRAIGNRNGARLHPELVARGARNGSRLHPEARPRGERHGMAKLTEAQVVDIRARAAAGETQRSIARDFGVSQPLVGCIVRRETWRRTDPVAG